MRNSSQATGNSALLWRQVLNIGSYHGPSITTTFLYFSFGDQRLIILEVDVTLDYFPFLTNEVGNMLTWSSCIYFCLLFNLVWSTLLTWNPLINKSVTHNLAAYPNMTSRTKTSWKILSNIYHLVRQLKIS